MKLAETIYRGSADVSWSDGDGAAKALIMVNGALGFSSLPSTPGQQIWTALDGDEWNPAGLLLTIEKTVSPSNWPAGWDATTCKLYYGASMHPDLDAKFPPGRPGSGHPYGPYFYVSNAAVATPEFAFSAISTFLGTGGGGVGLGTDPGAGAFGFLQGHWVIPYNSGFTRQAWRRIWYYPVFQPNEVATATETHTFRVKVYERYTKAGA